MSRRAGAVTVTWNGPAVSAAARRGALAGLRRAADLVAEDADRRVPRDAGDLVASRQIVVRDADLTVEIIYGGGGGLPQAYAIRQHEDLTLHHPNGGEPKYLESALEHHRRDVGQILADAIRGEL